MGLDGEYGNVRNTWDALDGKGFIGRLGGEVYVGQRSSTLAWRMCLSVSGFWFLRFLRVQHL